MSNQYLLNTIQELAVELANEKILKQKLMIEIEELKKEGESHEKE